MPIPFALAGMAIISGSAGIYSALTLRRLVLERRRKATLLDNSRRVLARYETAVDSLARQRDITKDELLELGSLRLKVSMELIKEALDALELVDKLRLAPTPLGVAGESTGSATPDGPGPSLQELIPLPRQDLDASLELVDEGEPFKTAAELALGALGVFAEYKAPGDPPSLPKQVARNGTIRWLGMPSDEPPPAQLPNERVLGAIASSAVLGVGGLILDAEAKAAGEEEEAIIERAQQARAELNAARAVTRGIELRAQQTRRCLEALAESVPARRGRVERALQQSRDFDELGAGERRAINRLAHLISLGLRLVGTPIIDEEGVLTDESAESIGAAEDLV